MKIPVLEINEDKVISNLVISKVRDLINLRNFERNDKLPSERVMSEKLGFNRTQIREAIRRLEFYGVLKTISQSGSQLEVGLTGLNGMVDEIISLDTPSFAELLELRNFLELKIVRLASVRRTDNDLKRIRDCLNDLKNKISNSSYLEVNLSFHLAIAKASKNNTLISLMLLLISRLLKTYNKDTFFGQDLISSEIKKYENIYLAIESRDEKLGEKMISDYFYR